MNTHTGWGGEVGLLPSLSRRAKFCRWRQSPVPAYGYGRNMAVYGGDAESVRARCKVPR
jgi:hypothetical protein